MGRGSALIWDVVEEQFEEAAFLWSQWETALTSAQYTLAEVAEGPEERLAAHLDGVDVAGPMVDEPLLAPALTSQELPRVMASASVLAAAGRLDPILEAIQPDAPERSLALARAVGLSLRPGEEGTVAAWLRHDSLAVKAVALESLAIRGSAPLAELRELLGARDSFLLAAALRASPALGEAAREAIEPSLDAADREVRDAALGAGLRLGLRAAWKACQREADAGNATPYVLEVLATSGDPTDLERLAAAMKLPSLRRAALFAAGLSGTTRGAELCVQHLQDPEMARTAGEGFWVVTGLAIAGSYQLARPPEPDDEDLDRPALPAEDSALPFPDGELVQLYWESERSRFAEDRRYLFGQPWTPELALQSLALGATRRRHALARELAARSRGEWWLDTRAWARDQLRSQRRLAARADFALPFGRLLKP